MTRPARPEVAAEVLAVCPRCDARPGEMCSTATGRPAKVPHSARNALGWHEWKKGYGEGMRDIIDLFERTIADELRRTEDAEGRGDLATAVQTAMVRAKRYAGVGK